MEILLTGKNALVGGATQGLGKAIAMELARCGASVTLMARNEEKLRTVLNELPVGVGQEHRFLVSDFGDLERHKAMIDKYFAENKVDILINNTNGPKPGGVNDKRLPDFQEAFDLLFQINCYQTLAAVSGMKNRSWGRIINVSSLTVAEPSPNLILSNTMRTAWQSWSKSLSQEVASHNITVNTILTGFFETERMTSLIAAEASSTGRSAEELKAARQNLVPMKRLGNPEEYGYLAAFLASDQASYITGTSIPIDGGLLKSL